MNSIRVENRKIYVFPANRLFIIHKIKNLRIFVAKMQIIYSKNIQEGGTKDINIQCRIKNN